MFKNVSKIPYMKIIISCKEGEGSTVHFFTIFETSHMVACPFRKSHRWWGLETYAWFSELKQSVERARKEVIEEQTSLGVGIITDGEIERENYIMSFWWVA